MVVTCFIFVGILISDVSGLRPPRYVSDWFVMDTDVATNTNHTWTHGFGVVPYMHEVQVKSTSGFIYPGVKSGNGDNELNTPRGGVVCVYNANDVRVLSAYSQSTGAHLIYTGNTSYTPHNQETTQTASVRVRLWHPDDFPAPAQTVGGISLRAADDTNNYKVQAHTLGQVPILTIVQFAFTYVGAIWYGEAMGSSNHVAINTSTPLNWGGIVFGVNSKYVRLWAPSIFDLGGVINLCDGWGGGTSTTADDCFPSSGDYAAITIRMWTNLETCGLSLATSHSIGDYGDSHQYSLASTFDVDTDLVIVESVAVDGQFPGYHFHATGAAIFDGAGALGGMIYAYNGSAVRLWHPVTAGSYLIKIGKYMGPSPGYAHVSTQTSTIIRVWRGEIRDRRETFNMQSGTLRDTAHISKEVQVRSRIECASQCTEECFCKSANYRAQSTSGRGVCRMFLQSAEPADLTPDPDWKYMYMKENNRK